MNKKMINVANLDVAHPRPKGTRMTNHSSISADDPLHSSLSVHTPDTGKHPPPQEDRNLLGESWITDHPYSMNE